MRRTTNIALCVTLLGAVPYSACGDDTTSDTTASTSTRGQTSGSTGAAGSTGRATNQNTGGANTSTGSDGTTRTDGTNTSTVQLNDAQIASVSLTANMGEVQQNMVGVTRAKRDDVRSFAQDMVAMHTAAAQRETALAQSTNLTPADNATAQKLKNTSDQAVKSLQAASDDEFDDVFLRSQLDAHEMVLSMIENTLLPSAQAQPLKDELTMMQATVTMHLERVRNLIGED